VFKSSVLAKLIILVMVVGLLVQLRSEGSVSWATAGGDTARQTVPTRTPTPEPVTPTVATPTHTRTPVPPSRTATPETPTPSMTPTPTATLAMLTVDVDASVHSGPGETYAVVGSLEAGDTADVVGRNAEGSWWQIVFQGSTVWISDAVVTVNAEAYNVPVVDVPATDVAASGPATLPPAGGATWLLGVGMVLSMYGVLLLLAGVGAYRRGR
jgi:hypothetical protein